MALRDSVSQLLKYKINSKAMIFEKKVTKIVSYLGTEQFLIQGQKKYFEIPKKKNNKP